jgi:sugar phosphate isomerase/epimerase
MGSSGQENAKSVHLGWAARPGPGKSNARRPSLRDHQLGQRLNRRDFNRLGAGAVLFLPALTSLARSFGYDWKLGVITDQVDLNLGRVLGTFCPQYRLRWIEIRYLKLDGRSSYVYSDATPGQLKDIKRQMDDAGVKLSVLDSAVFKISLPGTVPVGESPAYVGPEQEHFGRQIDNLKRAADAAHALGTQKVRVFTFRRVRQPAALFSRIVDELEKALTVAGQHDITLLVENEYDCNVATGQEIVRLFQAIPDRRLMHNWDPCNAYETGEQPFPGVWKRLDHSRIAHIHLKDAAGKSWRPIGSGKIDFAGQFRALKELRYAGTLSLETRYQNAAEGQYASSVESMNGLLRVLRDI